MENGPIQQDEILYFGVLGLSLMESSVPLCINGLKVTSVEYITE